MKLYNVENFRIKQFKTQQRMDKCILRIFLFLTPLMEVQYEGIKRNPPHGQAVGIFLHLSKPTLEHPISGFQHGLR